MKTLLKLTVFALVLGTAGWFGTPKAEAGVSFGFSVGGPRWGVAVGHTPAYRYYGPRYRARPVVVRRGPRVRARPVVYGSRRGVVVRRGYGARPVRRGRVVVW